MLDTMTTQH